MNKPDLIIYSDDPEFEPVLLSVPYHIRAMWKNHVKYKKERVTLTLPQMVHIDDVLPEFFVHFAVRRRFHPIIKQVLKKDQECWRRWKGIRRHLESRRKHKRKKNPNHQPRTWCRLSRFSIYPDKTMRLQYE